MGIGDGLCIAEFAANDDATVRDFGDSVAVDNNIAVVGARGEGGSGSVYVFGKEDERNWRQIARLSSAEEVPEDEYGSPVAISGNLVAVGRHGRDSNAGAAYLFCRGESGDWRMMAKLTSPDPSATFFGRSIAVWGRAVLVGAPGNLECPVAAYLFAEDNSGTWNPVAKLAPRKEVFFARFGCAVAMNEKYIAVGASLENTPPAPFMCSNSTTPEPGASQRG